MATDYTLLLVSFWSGFSLAFVLLVYINHLREVPPKLSRWFRALTSIPFLLGLFGAAGLGGFIGREYPAASNLSAVAFLIGAAYGLGLVWWLLMPNAKG